MLEDFKYTLYHRDAKVGRATVDPRDAQPARQGEETGATDPRVLPEEDVFEILQDISYQRRKYTNCSVVGNDSSMRRSKLGAHIDAADTVYRMNFAPIKSYAEDIGRTTHTQCLNPNKFRSNHAENPGWVTDAGSRPRVLVVGDTHEGRDASGNLGPCVEISPGGSCVKRIESEQGRILSMDAGIQTLTEELLATVQSGVGEADGVPTTGLYCLVLALIECASVDVYGMGVGTINHNDLSDLEYFKDPDFKGWDSRHNAEAERALLRVLASRVWKTTLVSQFGRMTWHNPLSVMIRNEALIVSGDGADTGSGIRRRGIFGDRIR